MARAVNAANDSLAARTPVDTTPVAVGPADAASAPTPQTEVTSPPSAVEPPALSKAVSKPTTPVASTTTKARPAVKRPVSRWVRSVSRHWVIVRSGASKQSRIIASIWPNSRVELGESRGDWRRIRARGINGWVEPRSSFEVVASR
jgi:uncharacterized protein YgiM (DUF1202 family)